MCSPHSLHLPCISEGILTTRRTKKSPVQNRSWLPATCRMRHSAQYSTGILQYCRHPRGTHCTQTHCMGSHRCQKTDAVKTHSTAILRRHTQHSARQIHQIIGSISRFFPSCFPSHQLLHTQLYSARLHPCKRISHPKLSPPLYSSDTPNNTCAHCCTFPLRKLPELGERPVSGQNWPLARVCLLLL